MKILKKLIGMALAAGVFISSGAFADTVKIAINRDISAPDQIAALPDKKEKFDILDNNLQKVKKYILEKIQ